jgi:hypothetical protein
MVGHDGWREKSGELEPIVTVGSDHHRDLDLLVTQPDDTSGPLSLDHAPAFELQPELGEEGDGVIQRLHDDADVVHPEQRTLGHGQFRVMTPISRPSPESSRAR